MSSKRSGDTPPPDIRILDWLSARPKSEPKGVRRVYLGLRARLTLLAAGLLGLIAVTAGLLIYWTETENPVFQRVMDYFGGARYLPFQAGRLTVLALAAALPLAGAVFLFSRIARKQVRRLEQIEAGALQLARGEYAIKLREKARDEIGRLADILNNLAASLREKSALEPMVSRTARKMIKQSDSESGITPGAWQRIQLSFVFSDVRGFTAFAEQQTPEEVMAALNAYFEIQYQVIRRLGGDVDDYVGDQVMAHFGGRNHQDRACRAALAIRMAAGKLNAARRKSGLPCFELGTGVHSGQVVTGNIGAAGRMDFACVGDAVNTGSRLCASAGPGEILVSAAHLEGTGSNFRLSPAEKLPLKGKRTALTVHRLLDEE